METFTTYVVQSYDKRYELWGNCSEPTESMFGLPVTDYETEKEGRARLVGLAEKYPTGTFRLIRRTVTSEVI